MNCTTNIAIPPAGAHQTASSAGRWLQNGQSVVADAACMRESILTPAAKVVADYQPVMPTYQGQVSEESILNLIAYIRSLPMPAVEPGK
jgi:cytochrome c oxidase subunit 2